MTFRSNRQNRSWKELEDPVLSRILTMDKLSKQNPANLAKSTVHDWGSQSNGKYKNVQELPPQEKDQNQSTMLPSGYFWSQSARLRNKLPKGRRNVSFDSIKPSLSDSLSRIAPVLQKDKEVESVVGFPELNGKDWVSGIDEWVKNHSNESQIKNFEEFMLNLGSEAQVKANKYSVGLPNINMKMVDLIMRKEGEDDPSKSKDADETRNKKLSLAQRLDQNVFQNGNPVQLIKFYNEANAELLRKVMGNKLSTHPEKIVGKRQRDREKYLQETAKDYINNFEALSKVYTKKVGDEHLFNEFGDMITDYGIRDLIIKRKHLKAKLESNSNLRFSKSKLKKGLNKSSTNFTVQRGSSVPQSPKQSKVEEVPAQTEKDKVDNSHQHLAGVGALQNMKQQLIALDELVKGYIMAEKDLKKRKDEMLFLEEKRKKHLVELQKLKDEIMRVKTSGETQLELQYQQQSPMKGGEEKTNNSLGGLMNLNLISKPRSEKVPKHSRLDSSDESDSNVNNQLVDHTVFLVARMKNLRDPLNEINNQIEQEMRTINGLKNRKSKMKSYLLSIYHKLLKFPEEALEYDMNIKNVVKQMEEIGEKVSFEMIGGDLFDEEKKLLVDIAVLQNKWSIGKQYIKDHHAEELHRSRSRLGLLKKMNLEMFPSTDGIIKTICRKGVEEATNIFDKRKKEIQEYKKISASANKNTTGSDTDTKDMVSLVP